MTADKLLFNALWIIHPVLECVAIGILLHRKHHKKFPFFLVYLVVQVVYFCVLFPVYTWASDRFFDRYYMSLEIASTVVCSALAFKVLHEVFLEVFRPFHTLRDLGSIMFRWIGLVTLLVSVVVAASTPANLSPLSQASVALQRCLRMSQVGFVLFLLVFSTYLGIRRRDLSFGIAAGFGAFAFWELVTWALWFSGHGPMSLMASNIGTSLVYVGSLMCWSVYARQESKVRLSDSTTLQSQRWERSLTEVQHPVGGGALIPMFESMVEQALTRAKMEYRTAEEPAGSPTDEKKKTMGAGK
jgi:hypothetical protein